MLMILFLAALFQTGQIKIGESLLQVEIADTRETQLKGLRGRTELSSGSGMLFVFDRTKYLSFWMKSTQIPLSIAFFNEDRELVEVLDMLVPLPGKLLPCYRSSSPCRYALEVPQHWFQENGIVEGMKFSFMDQPD